MASSPINTWKIYYIISWEDLLGSYLPPLCHAFLGATLFWSMIIAMTGQSIEWKIATTLRNLSERRTLRKITKTTRQRAVMGK